MSGCCHISSSQYFTKLAVISINYISVEFRRLGYLDESRTCPGEDYMTEIRETLIDHLMPDDVLDKQRRRVPKKNGSFVSFSSERGNGKDAAVNGWME